MNENYEQMIAGLVTRTMRGQGFIGDITVTNVRNDRGIHRADVRATFKGAERSYKAAIGGKRGIRVTAVSAAKKVAA